MYVRLGSKSCEHPGGLLEHRSGGGGQRGMPSSGPAPAREHGDGNTFDPSGDVSDGTLREEGWIMVPNRLLDGAPTAPELPRPSRTADRPFYGVRSSSRADDRANL